MGDAYRGDETLDRLLRQAGSRLGVAEVRDLVRGVAAAPEPFEPDAWMALVTPRPGRALAGQLAALRAEMAGPDGDGRDVPDGESRARLEALRGELKRRRLHGFVVPRGDEHQGEYVARRSERLAWLTGFTGSAGTAVVLRERAAVFVDGRYTLQVRAQADPALYEFPHLTESPPTDWIAAHLPPRARLGYDPWLHTPDQVARLRAACEKAGAGLTAVDGNPVDAVWRDQPPPPVAPVVPHGANFAGMTAARKRRRVARDLARQKVDAAVLTATDSIAWLLNLRGGDVPFAPLLLAFAILHADGAVDLFMDSRKLTGEARRHLGKGVAVHPPDAFGAALERLGAAHGTVRLDPASAPAWVLERLKKAGARVSAGTDPCALPKACKNAVEIEGIRAAHRRDGAAVSRFLAWLAVAAPAGGLTEIEAARRLEAFRREDARFRGPSFPTIAGAAANGAIVHYRVTEKTSREVPRDCLFLVDSGGQYLDGTTDVTRTVAVGTPSAEMRERFTRVLKGHIAIATARFPIGTTGSQLDPLARRALWEVGLDYDHGTGHGVGAYLCVHEGPQRIAKHPNRFALEPGMVVSNEPGYYKAGEYGIRIENLVTVIPADAPAGAEKELLGFETLTLAPIDLALVKPSLLTGAERAWLDAYHARVRETLRPLVDADTAAWLEAATRPLA